MSIIPISEWYPYLYSTWVAEGRRISVDLTERVGYTVHHTAGGDNQSSLSYAQFVARFHYFDRGWNRPGGYNFLIGINGNIYEMCGWDYVGAHAVGFNRNRIGVSFQGTFSNKMPNQDQLDSFSWLVNSHDIPNNQNRHRDNGSSSCPGDTLASAVPLHVAPLVPELTWLEKLMSAGEKQLGDIATALSNSATQNMGLTNAVSSLVRASTAQASVEVAYYVSKMREEYNLPPDSHSDAIHGYRIAKGEYTLSDAGDRLKERTEK